MREPKIGDQVVYHPRPSDRIRKPDNYFGLVSHTATIAHIHNGVLNLGVLDSGGYPYAVQGIPLLPAGAKFPEFGGWAEWPEDVKPKQKDPIV